MRKTWWNVTYLASDTSGNYFEKYQYEIACFSNADNKQSSQWLVDSGCDQRCRVLRLVVTSLWSNFCKSTQCFALRCPGKPNQSNVFLSTHAEGLIVARQERYKIFERFHASNCLREQRATLQTGIAALNSFAMKHPLYLAIISLSITLTHKRSVSLLFETLFEYSVVFSFLLYCNYYCTWWGEKKLKVKSLDANACDWVLCVKRVGWGGHLCQVNFRLSRPAHW